MLQNVYFLAKIGAGTAENEQHFANILPIGRRVAERPGRFNPSGEHGLGELEHRQPRREAPRRGGLGGAQVPAGDGRRAPAVRKVGAVGEGPNHSNYSVRMVLSEELESEFGQNSFKIQEFSLIKFKNNYFGKFQHFVKHRRKSDKFHQNLIKNQ